MFAVCEAEEGAPGRLVRSSAFQPEFVDPVTRSVAIALHDAIQAEEDLIWLPDILNCFCEREWPRGGQVDLWPVRPFGRRPILCRIESCLVARIGERVAESLQVALRTASSGESASDKTNLHTLDCSQIIKDLRTVRAGLRQTASDVILQRFMEKEPRHVLNVVSARIGGVGLDSVAYGVLCGVRVSEVYRAAMAIHPPQLVR